MGKSYEPIWQCLSYAEFPQLHLEIEKHAQFCYLKCDHHIFIILSDRTHHYLQLVIRTQ